MKEYINIDGTERRFEANFNAFGKALQLLGMDDLNGLVDITKARPSTFPVLFSCCLNEGARLDGSDWRISPEDTGTLDMNTMAAMIAAFARQGNPDVSDDPAKKAPGAQ